jgi:hypothetical protein
MDALGGIRLGRLSKLEEVGNLVPFRISPRAAATSGTEYVIDGEAIPTASGWTGHWARDEGLGVQFIVTLVSLT